MNDIAIKFEKLPTEQKKGLSIANLKRYKKSIEVTKIDGIIKLVKQLEDTYGLVLSYNAGLPVLNANDEVIIKESNIEVGSPRRANYIKFVCYYMRSDNAVGTATLQLDIANTLPSPKDISTRIGKALFSVYYKAQGEHKGGKIELSGEFAYTSSISPVKSENFISISLSNVDPTQRSGIPSNLLFYLRNKDIEHVTLMAGTYTSFSRAYGNSVAGLMLAEKKLNTAKQDSDTGNPEIEETAPDSQKLVGESTKMPTDTVPGWVGNYLHGKRFFADDLYNTELEEYIQSNSFENAQGVFVGDYVGYYIRSTGIVPAFERFKVTIKSDGTAIMKSADAFDYHLHFQKIDARLLIGYLEREEQQGTFGFTSGKERLKRWGTYSRVMFAFQQIEQNAANPREVLLYGIYGGVEHSNRSPISGRIVLRKIGPDESAEVDLIAKSLDEEFFDNRDSMFIENNLDLKEDIQSYLHGKLLQKHTDYIGANRLVVNLKPFLIGNFLCISIFTEEDNNSKFKIGKYPLTIKYPNTVTLHGRTKYTGHASYHNNLLVINLIDKDNDSIEMEFRVRGSQWDHAYGVSISRRGVNPESRAEILLNMNENHFNEEKYNFQKAFIYNESYLIDEPEEDVQENKNTKKDTANSEQTNSQNSDLGSEKKESNNNSASETTQGYSKSEREPKIGLIELSEFISKDDRLPYIVHYLRGEYNRYIVTPHSVSDYRYDYEIRVNSERRSPFYAAYYIILKFNNWPKNRVDEKKIECKNYLRKAYFHGFAIERDFGKKNNFDESKLRIIRQFEDEIREELKLLVELRELLLKLNLKDINNYIEKLWANEFRKTIVEESN